MIKPMETESMVVPRERIFAPHTEGEKKLVILIDEYSHLIAFGLYIPLQREKKDMRIEKFKVMLKLHIVILSNFPRENWTYLTILPMCVSAPSFLTPSH